MITYVAIASLLVSAMAGLWLVLANLRSGPQRRIACVVVGGLGLFLVMTLFIGPHSFDSSPESSPPVAKVTPGPTAEPVVPTAADPLVGGLNSWASSPPSGPACETAPEASFPPIASGVVDGIELALVGVGTREPVGDFTGTSSQMTLHFAVTATADGAETGPRRFPLSELWLLPEPPPSGMEFNPQPLSAAIMAGGVWRRLPKLSDVRVEASTTCSVVVEFLIPPNARSAVLYLGYRSLWTFQIPTSR